MTDDLESKGANTGADGRFTVEGEALDEVGVWEIQAHFAGDDENNASDSNIENYTIVKPQSATTYLKLDTIPDVIVTGNITVEGVLGGLTNRDQGDVINGKTITFTTTGGENLGSVITDVNGKFTVTGKASDKEGVWKIQAHFKGYDENNASDSNVDSNVETYKTTPVLINAEAITVQQFANEGFYTRYFDTTIGKALHINVEDLKWCDEGELKDKKYDDKHEISKQGRDMLNYKPRDKGIPKTIEYTIRYDCDKNKVFEIIKQLEDLYKLH